MVIFNHHPLGQACYGVIPTMTSYLRTQVSIGERATRILDHQGRFSRGGAEARRVYYFLRLADNKSPKPACAISAPLDTADSPVHNVPDADHQENTGGTVGR